MKPPSINVRKIFLQTLIASVSISAILGIVVVTIGNFGYWEEKILLTTLTVTLTSMLGLAGGACYETGRGRFLALLAIITAVITGAAWITTIWAGTIGSEIISKLLLAVTTTAFASSLLSLLTIARLDRRFRWSLIAAHVCVWTFVVILNVVIWSNFSDSSDIISRILIVLGITIAALTLMTPVFHRLSNQLTGIDEIDAEIALLEKKLTELRKKRDELTEIKVDEI